jgi:hypothetical protein
MEFQEMHSTDIRNSKTFSVLLLCIFFMANAIPGTEIRLNQNEELRSCFEAFTQSCRELLQKRDTAMTQIDESFKESISTTREELVGKLKSLMDRATEAKNLDLAIEIRELVRIYEACTTEDIVAIVNPPEAKKNRIPRNAFKWEGHHYLLVREKATYNGARKFCESVGGYLARIESREENRILFEQVIKDYDENVVRIDGNDEDEEGVWRYSDQTIMDYLNWADGEPNNVQEVEHSLAISWTTSEFTDVDLGSRYAFLVEWDE